MAHSFFLLSIILSLYSYSISIMKKTFFISNFVAFLFYIFLMGASSCNRKDNSPKEQSTADTFYNPPKDSLALFTRVEYPGDFFSGMKKFKIQSRELRLSPVANVKLFQNRMDQGLNFGIYLSDLCYLSFFNQKANLTGYLDNIKILSEKFNGSALLSQEIFKEISKPEANRETRDSMVSLLFSGLYETLEKKDDHPLLAFIEAGSFIENIYISTQLCGKYSADNPLIQYIADQKFSLDNLFELMKSHATDKGIPEMMEMLKPCQDIFNSMEEVSAEKQNIPSSKRRVIGSDTRYKLSESDYNKLKALTEKLHNEITQTKIP